MWIGIDHSAGRQLEQQSQIVNKLLSPIKTLKEVDVEKFNPHVTIARMKSGKKKENLVSFIRERKSKEFGVTKIQRLRLKLSTLMPSGPEYSDIHVFDKQ